MPNSPEDDTQDQAHARAAEQSGRSRQQKLQDFANGNPWIQSFFADHTFEVDFIRAGNSFEVVRTLDDIYQKTASRQWSTERLESDNPQVAGKEILRLADKLGKGWFALLLSARLDSRTYIPDYILRAVAFACHPSVTGSALRRIGEFRVKALGPNGDLARVLPPSADLERLSLTDFLAVFREAAPDDDLSLFCQYLGEYRQR